MSTRRPPFVRILATGASLATGSLGCSAMQAPTEPATTPAPAPAAPEPAADAPVSSASVSSDAPSSEPVAPALPPWDQVESGHPVGATNPPVPILVVTLDDEACFKAWTDPRAVPEMARSAGGVVLGSRDELAGLAVGSPTEIVCPEDQPQTLIDRIEALEAD